MKRRYILTWWVAGTYRAIGTDPYWTLRGARRAAGQYRRISAFFQFTILDTKTGRTWHL